MAPRSLLLALLSLLLTQSNSAPQAFKRETGHPQWHHGAFHDVRDNVRSDVRRMLHSRAEVSFFFRQIKININVQLVYLLMHEFVVCVGSVSSSARSERGSDWFQRRRRLQIQHRRSSIGTVSQK